MSSLSLQTLSCKGVLCKSLLCKRIPKLSPNPGSSSGRRSPRVGTIQTALILQVIVLSALLFAATSSLLSQAPPSPVAIPTVTFTLDFPQSNPAHYLISVDAAGHAHYECTAKVEEDSEAQPYSSEFEISTANREKIFAWSKQAKYFAGKIDSGNDKVAFTGKKRLSYQDGRRSSAAEYNYSNQEAVRQLTTLFQSIADTLEYGRRLAYYHHYEKLALDEELKHMEAQAKSNELSEIQGVAAVLRDIAEDPSVMNVVRARAKELMELGNTTSQVR